MDHHFSTIDRVIKLYQKTGQTNNSYHTQRDNPELHHEILDLSGLLYKLQQKQKSVNKLSESLKLEW